MRATTVHQEGRFERLTANARGDATMEQYCNVRAWDRWTTAYADLNGTIHVYDDVAGYYTTCHSLTPRQCQYVRRMATRKAA